MHARQDEASSSKQKKREFAGKISGDISTVGRVRVPPPALTPLHERMARKTRIFFHL
jgi:hypothetical protein